MGVEKTIWDSLKSAGLTDEGAAGVMGNIFAESGMIPNRVEILCLSRLRQAGKAYNDSTYTAAVDSGKISKAEFLHPLPNKQYGYGLCQWTSPGRKEGLYNLCKSKGVSIGDTATQIEWLMTELNESSYAKTVLAVLKKTKNILTASNTFLEKFEIPGDTGVPVRQKRYEYSLKYYNELRNGGSDMAVHYISNSGGDERGKISGGTAGDQTGKEWQLRSWYSRPWNCVLRHPNAAVREKIAELGRKAAQNNKIGYDQNQRDTYWQQLQKAGYDPSKITVACEADCSAGVIANVKATGYLLGIKNLQNIAATYTGNMRSAFKAAGFMVLVDSKYLISPDYLLPGDILLNDQHHTATNISAGSKACGTAATQNADSNESKIVGTCSVTLKQFLVGANDPQVKTIQTILNQRGYKGKDGKALSVDGDLGSNTAYAITEFQKAKGMKNINFGSVASTTWKYLLNA